MKVKTAKKTHYLLQFFTYEHLPSNELQKASKPFCKLAQEIVKTFPDNPQTEMALLRLLEAKDCAVRSMLCERVSKATPDKG